MNSNTFGASAVMGLGFTAIGFKGNRGSLDSGAITSDCATSYHLFGGAYLASSGAQMKATYTGL